MVQQIVLNFDATGFEGFERAVDYFGHCSRTLKDAEGRSLKGHYQAADMDMSPQQWSNKLCESNNTTITLNDAELYTEKFDDPRWIYYLVQKHIVDRQRNVDELERLRAQLDKQIAAARKKKVA